MKHEKPQKNPGVHNIRLSDLSQKEGRMEMKFRDNRGSQFFYIRDNGY